MGKQVWIILVRVEIRSLQLLKGKTKWEPSKAGSIWKGEAAAHVRPDFYKKPEPGEQHLNTLQRIGRAAERSTGVICVTGSPFVKESLKRYDVVSDAKRVIASESTYWAWEAGVPPWDYTPAAMASYCRHSCLTTIFEGLCLFV